MNTQRWTERLSRRQAEGLLDGQARATGEPLVAELGRLLDAAKAPASSDELAREDATVTWFHAARLDPALGQRRAAVRTRALGRLAPLKVVVATGGTVLLLSSAGFALAASHQLPWQKPESPAVTHHGASHDGSSGHGSSGHQQGSTTPGDGSTRGSRPSDGATDSTHPTHSADPTHRAHPSHPAHPSKPAHPTHPAHPSKPAHPTHPAHPTKPAHPSKPAHPTHSATPHPSKPAQPTKPSKPAHPSKPAQPSETTTT